jgi:hypothetical protein
MTFHNHFAITASTWDVDWSMALSSELTHRRRGGMENREYPPGPNGDVTVLQQWQLMIAGMVSTKEYLVLVFARAAADELQAQAAIRGHGSAHAMSLVSRLSTGTEIAIAVPQLSGWGGVALAAAEHETRSTQMGRTTPTLDLE